MNRILLSLLAALLVSAPVLAQEGVTSAFEGFSGRGEQPVNIEADRLDVQELEQTATFAGNVVVVQGASKLRANKLTIFYEKGGGDEQAQKAAPQGDVVTGRQIKRLEADGNVIVTSGEQKATGNRGVFNMASNTAQLIGDVVVTQGPNILKGDVLHVDLTTQTSRVESKSGRVQGTFGKTAPKPGAPGTAPAPQRIAPTQ
ncbi:organic solvent tolerance protein OstA [Terrihabitans soli]|uniref:Organic solvent tolerance protein OstA n=1 Tax=Terrihabitans soli TaxID=708113 RepID=A0A6S6QSK9_9HYPH|nr:lipopolysaccharide transport periplasmic protein LptA [Terrihabitans soli]BCJ92079.1 organic solvent tolerance protein OstA [Terrihabitans soli]